jgi:serine phosphatase RsbU (regulator of sigma subunit)/putative methionine-R-sulfoxide reductase with GAF domain
LAERPGEHERKSAALGELLAVERAARAASQQTERWVDSLRLAARDAFTSLSLDGVLREALEATAGLLGGDAASVLLASDDGSELSARAAVGLNKDIDLDIHVPRGKGFAGTILASRAPFIIGDMRKTTVVSPTLRESGLRSLVGVPLMAGRDVVGVLHVGSAKLDFFSEADAEVLEIIAEPLAAAIQRVRLFEAERRARVAAEVALGRLGGLQRITAALASTTSVDEVCRVILEETRVGLSGIDGGGSIWMLRGDELVLAAGSERSRRYPVIPLDASMPPAVHLESGEPLFVETREELATRWPVLSSAGVSAFAAFPLKAGTRTLGLMAVGYVEEHHFDEGERSYLIAIAEQASHALDRALTRERETRDHEMRSFVAEATLALSAPYAEPEQLLQQLTDLVVPKLADWATVLLLEGQELKRVAYTARPAVITPNGREIAALPVPIGEDSIAGRVVRSGRPILASLADVEEASNDRFNLLAGELGIVSVMVVPLISHGRTIGIMSFGACDVHPEYEPSDLGLAVEIAGRAALAAEDAMERSRERALAAMLTRALLPAHFPSRPDVEFAARYVPADAGPVGGDWYDVFELADGRLGLAVGDVSGHGVEAASTMARLRMGLFAYASEGHDAHGIFDRLAAMLAEPGDGLESGLLATVTYAVYDRSRRRLDVSCAGHLPYVLVREGEAELIDCGGRVLVPGLPAMESERTLDLQEDDTLLFLTDGLVERHDEPLDEGLRRLVEAARESSRLQLEELCDEVLGRTAAPGGRRDDCCLLAMRLH